jgi:t-SNARE complex subunit (syntaxin)
MINQETLNKIIRKKVIWAEVKAKEQEYQRINKQIDELKQAQKDISFDIQKKLEESQVIADWMLEQEYNELKKLNK